MSQEENNLDALTAQAELAIIEGNIRRLIFLYQRMEQLGVWQASARIGELYETGFGNGAHTFEKNLDEAVKWYRKSVFESDDPVAHLGLGRIYYEGSATVKKDISKAQTHLRKAYENDLPQAGIYLGAMSMFGVGVEKNLADAERFFSTAAAAGFPLAYRYLANMAASSGRLIRTIEMLSKELILSVKLRIQDRNHPNLWKMPREQ
jgi:TPR repeat protein